MFNTKTTYVLLVGKK